MKLLERKSVHFILLACAALLPRIFTLGRAFTTDEAYHWQHRAPAFLAAVREGRFADTILTGHPGVTTMWLGSFGIMLENLLQAIGLLGSEIPFETHLTFLRLPLTLTTVIAVLIAYHLLSQLVPSKLALLAGLLLGSDPFLVGHSRVLHLDALLSYFTLLATLSLIVACFDAQGVRSRPKASYLLLASLFSGFAFVTKAPGILLLPIGGCVLLAWAFSIWRQPAEAGQTGASLGYLFGQLVRNCCIWLIPAALVAFITWPAMWVVPGEAVNRVVREVIDNGGEPMHWGNFLLGQAEKDPGLLYYVVTLAGRTTPWTALGLVALLVAAIRWRAQLARRDLVIPMIALAMLIIVAAMSVTAKKADRYALPAVPLLQILASVGLYWLGGHLPMIWRRLGMGLIVVASAATLAWLHPYYLAYFGPLVGGSAGAPKLVPIGWGEGLDVTAEWLNQQPDIGQRKVATWSPPTLLPYLNAETTWQGDVTSGNVNYLVVYVAQAQSGKESQYFGSYYPKCEPLHVIQVRNIDYAWIYRVNRHRNDYLFANFGDSLQLDGYDLLTPDTCTSPGALKLTLHLTPKAGLHENLFLFLHVLDSSANKIQEINLPLQSIIPAEAVQSGESVPYVIEIPFPSDAPNDLYQLIAGIFDMSTGQRIPIINQADPPAEQVGPDLLNLADFAVSPSQP